MRIKELRESRNMQQKELASILGISPNALSQYENGKREANQHIVSRIAEFFNVSVDYIYERTDIVKCSECGLSYSPLSQLDIEVHSEYHTRWLKARIKYGEFYNDYGDMERIKAENKQIVMDKSIPLSQREKAQIEVYKCLFSRSLIASNYDHNHILFNDYVAMMLDNPKLKKELGEDLYSDLVMKYGTKPGISHGKSYYNIDLSKEKDGSIVASIEKLNDNNKKRVSKYIEYLIGIQSFENELNAAHQRTDIEIPKGIDTTENDIMDDENF